MITFLKINNLIFIYDHFLMSKAIFALVLKRVRTMVKNVEVYNQFQKSMECILIIKQIFRL
jgi:hypothetical protein